MKLDQPSQEFPSEPLDITALRLMLDEQAQSVQDLARVSHSTEKLLESYMLEIERATRRLERLAFEAEHGTSETAAPNYAAELKRLEMLDEMRRRIEAELKKDFDAVIASGAQMQAVRAALAKFSGNQPRPQA